MFQAERGLSRSTAYSYVSVKAESVYPVGTYSNDNYKYCKTQIYHNTIGNTPISKKVQLMEGSDYKNVTISEGYLDQTLFDLCFSGNSPYYGAVIVYDYKGN